MIDYWTDMALRSIETLGQMREMGTCSEVEYDAAMKRISEALKASSKS